MNDAPRDNTWWGPVTVGLEQSVQFHIGPLCLTISRRANEWRVRRELNPGPGEEEPMPLSLPARDSPDARITRHGISHPDTKLELTPVMPDRSVVTRPEHPIVVPAREAVSLYVGSPLWVRISEPNFDRVLEELPVVPPALAWWGENTQQGELCYATRTFGRLRLEDAPINPHRVMTAVRIINAADSALTIERLHLPVKALAVHVGALGRLWTEAVTLERERGEAFAKLEVGHTPGKEAGEIKLVGQARKPRQEREMVRAFGRIFRF